MQIWKSKKRRFDSDRTTPTRKPSQGMRLLGIVREWPYFLALGWACPLLSSKWNILQLDDGLQPWCRRREVEWMDGWMLFTSFRCWCWFTCINNSYQEMTCIYIYMMSWWGLIVGNGGVCSFNASLAWQDIFQRLRSKPKYQIFWAARNGYSEPCEQSRC